MQRQISQYVPIELAEASQRCVGFEIDALTWTCQRLVSGIEERRQWLSSSPIASVKRRGMVPRQIVVGYVPFGTVPQRRAAPLTLLREDVFDFVQVSRRAAEEIGSLSILAVACDRCAFGVTASRSSSEIAFFAASIDCGDAG